VFIQPDLGHIAVFGSLLARDVVWAGMSLQLGGAACFAAGGVPAGRTRMRWPCWAGDSAVGLAGLPLLPWRWPVCPGGSALQALLRPAHPLSRGPMASKDYQPRPPLVLFSSIRPKIPLGGGVHLLPEQGKGIGSGGLWERA